MAHNTLIDGVAYSITGGKCKIDGTAYDIIGGKTRIDGTGYDIAFGGPTRVYVHVGNSASNYYASATINGVEHDHDINFQTYNYDPGVPVELVVYARTTVTVNGVDQDENTVTLDVTGKNVDVALSRTIGLNRGYAEVTISDWR